MTYAIDDDADFQRCRSFWTDLFGCSYAIGYVDAGGTRTRYLEAGDPRTRPWSCCTGSATAWSCSPPPVRRRDRAGRRVGVRVRRRGDALAGALLMPRLPPDAGHDVGGHRPRSGSGAAVDE